MTWASMFIASVRSSSSPIVRPVQAASAADQRDVHGRRSRDAGAHRRSDRVLHIHAARAEVADQPRDQRQPIDAERVGSAGLDPLAGIFGDEHDAVIARATSAGNARAG